MEGTLAILLPIIISLGAFTMIVFIRKFENQERLAMIDKGMAPELAKSKPHPASALRFSLLAIGIGIGILIGYFMGEYTVVAMGAAITSMIFVFGGIGLLISYIIHIKQEKEETQRLYK